MPAPAPAHAALAALVLLSFYGTAAAADPVNIWPPAATRIIDRELTEAWKEKGIRPASRATDHEFARRVTLDVIGRVATPEEIRQFLADPPATRRRLLVERLLGSQEYAANWATIWSVWLVGRGGPAGYREPLQAWLEGRFADRDRGLDSLAADLLTAAGKNTENGAVNFVLANLGEPLPPERQREGRFDAVPLTARATRLFLGVQVQCAQCHDHPFNHELKQQQFWGVDAFFRQVTRSGGAGRMRPGMAVEAEIGDDPKLDASGFVVFERRNGVVLSTRSTFLDGTPAPQSARTRREALAELVTRSDDFARAQVSRTWAHFFGRGLTASGAADDFGGHNPVTFPALLDGVAAEFRAHGHRPRDLVRWICASDAYNLSSAAAPGEKPETEASFARMPLRPLTPEQLFNSLMTATQADAGETPRKRQRLRDDWLRSLVVAFGDDEGNEATFNGTVVQALLLMNGRQINEALARKDRGPVVNALRRHGSARAVVDELFLAFLNRPATPREQQEITRRVPTHVGDRTVTAPWDDLAWALANSGEFILNH